jgi:excisionase family DNA binding protein
MKMLTTNEVAERLGVTVQRVHQFIKDARLPAQKMGRDYIINEDDLKGLEDRQTGRPAKAKSEGQSKPKADAVKQERAAKEKAISRWENDGGAVPSKKRGALPATPKFGTIETQTKTTRKLSKSVKQAADMEMGSGKKGRKK